MYLDVTLTLVIFFHEFIIQYVYIKILSLMTIVIKSTYIRGTSCVYEDPANNAVLLPSRLLLTYSRITSTSVTKYGYHMALDGHPIPYLDKNGVLHS